MSEEYTYDEWKDRGYFVIKDSYSTKKNEKDEPVFTLDQVEWKVYQISEEICAKNISGVCPGCGGVVEPIETVNNSDEPTFWSGCNHCLIFCCGVDKSVWQTARKLVEEGRGFTSCKSRHDYEDTPERLEYWKDTETSHLSGQIRQILFEYNKIVEAGK